MTPDIFIHKLKEARYPKAPFSPNKEYPELSNLPYKVKVDPSNEIYESIRDILINLGLDKENINKPNWDPLGSMLGKGKKALIKPNFVKGSHPLGTEGVLSMITHASLMRPIIDYLLIAGGKDTEIIIGDCPLQSSVWEEIIENSKTKDLIEFYKNNNIGIKLIDFRKEISIFNEENVIVKRSKNSKRQETDYKVVDLGKDSSFSDVIKYHKLFSITDYDHNLIKHHNPEVNEYCIPNEVLEADLFINLPKLKTHKKAGLTCSMKNLIGINGDKSWIPHHRKGTKLIGGDEFEKMKLSVFARERIWSFLKSFTIGIWTATLLKKIFKIFMWRGKTYEEMSMDRSGDDYREGSWWGNDTIWRPIKDLNSILLYADKEGSLKDTPQRKCLSIVDAVLSGEGEGPMQQTPKKTGIVYGGINPLYVDLASAKIMGFNYKLMPSISRSFIRDKYSLSDKKPADVSMDSNVAIEECMFTFKPSNGWKLLKEV
ncbi:MAG: DUF362 domain-containing protein [Candidatus Omnitrophota bacterium]